MSADRVAIVGAGIAGLAVAAELSPRGPVTVLDRLPVPGGVLGYEAPAVLELMQRCRRPSVEWMLGVTAVRWAEHRLLTVGPDGIRWLPFAQLVYAGGSRPATQAELRISGPRLAGVLPATVALHFAEAGVVLGRRIIVVGTGDWADAAGRALAQQDCEITVVADAEAPVPAFRHDGVIRGWSPIRVVGSSRVAGLFVERLGTEHRLTCDAVVLAAGPRPLRNVDGAVFDQSADVAFIQPIQDSTTDAWAAAQAAAAARTVIVQPRIEVTV